MLINIIKYSEFTCAIILLLFAVMQVIYKHRNFLNYNLAGLYFCLSYVIISFWALKSGLIFYIPWLLYTDITAAFAIGPFVYFYLNSVLGIKTGSHLKYMLHFIPAAAVLTIIITTNLIDDSLLQYHLHSLLEYPTYSLNPIIWGIDFLSNFSMILYFLMTARNIYLLLKNKSSKQLHELKIIFYYMSFILLFTSMMLIASILRNNILNITGIYLLTLSALWYFFFSFRFPEFTQKAIKEAKIIRYKNSLLKGIDAEAVFERLNDLMEEDNIFTDEKLTLQKLSELLMITPHQFSKILNSKREMNFRTFVNSYRIKESMKQMAEYPDKTILEIALASGFNSKSSFNSVFLKSTGQTPSSFREGLKG